MTFLSEDQLKTWLVERHLLWDDVYGSIAFSEETPDSRFWTIPARGARIVYLLNVLLSSMDAWDHLIICKKGATGWYSSDETTGIIDAVHDQIIASTGIPKDFVGATHATHDDLSIILTLLFDQLLFGWCQWDDVYVIPDHAKQIIMTSHHDVVHVGFCDPARVESFVAALAAGGFLLPDEPPDETFKTPEWMPKAS